MSHDESPATRLEGFGDPDVQERFMRETILRSLLNAPEVEEATESAEASGSGTIGGEVYAGTLGGDPSSLTVGYGCTYVASVTMGSSESHLDVHSRAAAGERMSRCEPELSIVTVSLATYVQPYPTVREEGSSSQGAGVNLATDCAAA